MQQYVTESLGLHLFFARIMKEHSLFLEAGFTPKNPDYSKTARQFKEIFEGILSSAVHLGNGIVSPAVISSGEIVTDFTLGMEQKTTNFTTIPIDTAITQAEGRMWGNDNPNITQELETQVKQLNANAKHYLDGLIEFKTNIYNNVISCNMFTNNYPSMIEHIKEEAESYRQHIMDLDSGKDIDTSAKNTEVFWDEIMMEHAQFIRGTLDPTENTLIDAANNFAKEYATLLQEAKQASETMMSHVTQSTLQETTKFRDFKAAGADGIARCKIRSIILPLLADHVLREANHYLRLLKQFR